MFLEAFCTLTCHLVVMGNCFVTSRVHREATSSPHWVNLEDDWVPRCLTHLGLREPTTPYRVVTPTAQDPLHCWHSENQRPPAQLGLRGHRTPVQSLGQPPGIPWTSSPDAPRDSPDPPRDSPVASRDSPDAPRHFPQFPEAAQSL